MSEKIRLLAIVGPTASGKTSFAVKMAQRFDGEVVSCDSMQVYKGMEIATAAPTKEEQQGIPHHLVSILEPTEDFSVSRFCDMANECIEDIAGRGKLPILCGGTGLYYSSLANGISFLDAPGDEALRRELYLRAEKEGGQALLDELAAFDPETAARLHPNHISRIVRAIEIYRISGMTLSQQNTLSRQNESRYDLLSIGINYSDRENLYSRINKRVDIMLESGIIEEARRCLAKDNGTAAQAIGHKELADFLAGAQSLDAAADRLKQQTRRYAKRQLTWFRRDERINWLYADSYSSQEEMVNDAVNIITKWMGVEE